MTLLSLVIIVEHKYKFKSMSEHTKLLIPISLIYLNLFSNISVRVHVCILVTTIERTSLSRETYTVKYPPKIFPSFDVFRGVDNAWDYWGKWF